MHVSDFTRSLDDSAVNNPESVAAAVRAGKLHQGGMKMWPLLRLDPLWLADLQLEVMALQSTETGSRVEDPAHPTHWVRPYGANPPARFLPLANEERDKLAESGPFPVNEYMEGTSSGEVLLFRKEEGAGPGQFKKSAKLTKDICDAWALKFGRGWWGCEEWDGQRFRGAAPSTELEIEAERDGMALLRLHVVAGPSAATGETVLTATDFDGAEHGQFELRESVASGRFA